MDFFPSLTFFQRYISFCRSFFIICIYSRIYVYYISSYRCDPLSRHWGQGGIARMCLYTRDDGKKLYIWWGEIAFFFSRCFLFVLAVANTLISMAIHPWSLYYAPIQTVTHLCMSKKKLTTLLFSLLVFP